MAIDEQAWQEPGDPKPTMAAEPIIEACGVTFSYPDGTVALRDLSMSIDRGRRVAILGANGCGKTTLFLHFNGLLRPTEGSVRIGGEAIRYNGKGLGDVRSRVGLIFQDPDSQLFAASVEQDISFGPLNLGWPEERVRAAVDRAINDTGLADAASRPTHLLSYGQKKRVAIAGVLAMEPDVIVADEPTAGLDSDMSGRLLDLLDQLHENGHSIIISTHDVELALAWADDVFLMIHGRIEATGSPEIVFQNQALLEKARLVQPIVLSTYAGLRERGVIPAGCPIPRTTQQLTDLVAASFQAGTGADPS